MTDPHPTAEAEAPAPSSDQRKQTVMSAALGFVALLAAVVLGWQLLSDDSFLRGGAGGAAHGAEAGRDPWGLPEKPVESRKVKDVTTCGDMIGRARVCSTEIDIDATFEPVSVGSSGELSIPTHSEYPSVGWYDSSASVGSTQGTSVLAGHVDFPYDNPSLGGLEKAKPGQRVWVSAGEGAVVSYVVTEVREPTLRTEIPSDIFTKVGDPQMSMVTCTGDYKQIKGTTNWSYTHNLIVDFALDHEAVQIP